jgi:hypothetical protein
MRGLWAGSVIVAAALAAAGCATDLPVAGAGCHPDGTGRLAGVDWEAAHAVEVRLRDGDFDPMVVAFIRDRPYVLRITNADGDSHSFSAPEFFRTAAIDSVAVNGARQEPGCVSTVGVPGGGTAEVRLMALRDGRYDLNDAGLVPIQLDLGHVTGKGFGAVYVE